MSDAATRARELLAAATPRPWEVRIRDSGDVDVVKDHEHIEWICSVGDEAERAAIADAELIAAAPTLLAELAAEVETAWRAYHAVADEVEVLHQRRIVSEGMVERAAKAYDDAVVDGLWTIQDLIRAALEAALGVES